MAPTDDANGLVVVQLMGNIGVSVSNTDAVEISRMLAHSLGGSFYTVNAGLRRRCSLAMSSSITQMCNPCGGSLV